MKTWFTADTHFCHENIIKYCNRPFRDWKEMDRALISNWNSVVAKEDVVYHLGDFAFGREAKTAWLPMLANELQGKIHLIKGNHDKVTVEHIPFRFESIQDYDEIEVEGQRIVLFHYGLRTWHHDLRGVWHLYGHSHGGLPPLGKSLDIGVDSWSFTPVSFARLKAVMDKRDVGKHPQFENFVGSV